MTFLVFGNKDLEFDSLPIKILDKLKLEFHEHEFVVLDPNEECDVSGEALIIDTVVGIEKVAMFESLDGFEIPPRLTTHDFDALSYLKYLKKIGKLNSVKVIGIPPFMQEAQALESVSEIIRTASQL